jgi:PAS domain S-box-containing protein
MTNKRTIMKLKIGNKIFFSFLALILLFVVNAAIIIYNGNKIDRVVRTSSEVIRPSKEAINDFILLVTRSKMLITNWVYLQSNVADKEALKDLHSREYPELKDQLISLKERWESDSQRVLLDSAFTEFESLMETETEIMGQLVTFENYEDPLVKLLAEDAIENQVIPATDGITGILQKLADRQQEITEDSDASMTVATNQLRNITIILGAILLVIGLFSAYLITRMFVVPLNYLKSVVLQLSKGQLMDKQKRKFSKDEMGEMAHAIDELILGLKSTTLFAENIGKGSYDSEFTPLSDEDVLGNALIEMRNNLARVAEEDKKRNWSTEGLALFGEILRKNNNNLNKLSDEIIANLVKYLSANQGGLFIIDEGEHDEPFMTLLSCYAWDKKKFVDEKILKGEGLAGQVWQEMDTVYLTDVPDNYVKITSGLGDANPRSILIVPLKVNDQIFGVVEIASFNEFSENEIEFVEKIAESIASTISSVKVNARTQKLLEESQEMTEQMRSQEEEMRQNMEELQATQEEMQRSQAEAESTMEALNASIAYMEFDLDGKILNVNERCLDILHYKKDDLLGEYHRILVSKEEKGSEEYREFWRSLSAGNNIKGEFSRISKLGETKHLYESYAPIHHRDGSISRIMMFVYDLTAHVKLKEEVAQG